MVRDKKENRDKTRVEEEKEKKKRKERKREKDVLFVFLLPLSLFHNIRQELTKLCGMERIRAKNIERYV